MRTRPLPLFRLGCVPHRSAATVVFSFFSPFSLLSLFSLLVVLAASAVVASPSWADEVASSSSTDEVAVSVGPGIGQVGAFPSEGGCVENYLNADGTYENGFAWQYGGAATPYYGAFAECYDTPTPICAVFTDLTNTGFHSQVMDVYVWSDGGDVPGAVSCVRPGVNPGPIGFWPSVSRHVIEIDCVPGSRSWVGYWGDWPNTVGGWFVGADLDGPGGCPRTNIAPGLGYPSGWQNVSVVWGPTQALGIGVALVGSPAEGACCLEDSLCTVLAASECEVNGGSYQGDGVPCEPNPCSAVPAIESSWGQIKETFRSR